MLTNQAQFTMVN